MPTDFTFPVEMQAALFNTCHEQHTTSAAPPASPATPYVALYCGAGATNFIFPIFYHPRYAVQLTVCLFFGKV